MRQLFLKAIPLITCLAAFNPQLHAQTECKYVKKATDEWSREVVRTAQMAIGAGLAGREVILQESAGKFYLALRITYNSDFPEVAFKKGDKITFKLADEKLIEVTAQDNIPVMIVRFLDMPMRQWLVRQEVKPEIFRQLSASPITAIKFHLNGNDYPLPEIKERQTRKIMETAKCLLETTTH